MPQDPLDTNPVAPRRGRVWLGAAALMLLGGVGGRLLDLPTTDAFDRTAEAVGDLAVPAARALDARDGAERLRAELEDFLETQERHVREHGRPLQLADVPMEADGIATVYQVEGSGAWWVAEMRLARASSGGPSCAAAVGRVPLYVGGIVLRREGEVRCSGDLATRLNRLWRRVTSPWGPR